MIMQCAPSQYCIYFKSNSVNIEMIIVWYCRDYDYSDILKAFD